MKKHIANVSMLVVVLFSYSCEYPLRENYIDVKPPLETPLSIDLNVITDGQCILINKSCYIDYSLSAFDKKVTGVVFRVGNIEWTSTDANGRMPIDSYLLPSGEYTLTGEFYIKSGSGSIADQLDAESFVGTISWPVLVDYDMELPNLLTYEIDQDGYLQLSWPKPVLSHLKVKAYHIRYESGNYSDCREYVISNPEQTTFTDKEYIGKPCTYHVSMELTADDQQSLFWDIGQLQLPDESVDYVASTAHGNVNAVPFSSTKGFVFNLSSHTSQ